MELIKVNQFPHDIMLGDEEPCVSIYMPTHKRTTDWKQDKTRLRNLINEAEKSLLEIISREDVEKILKPVRNAMDNHYFWNSVEDSLAILLKKEESIYYTMNRDVEEFVLVSDEFYIKPLIRNFQSYDKYHVLGLSREEFILYEGSRYSFEEVVLDGSPTRKEDIFDQGDREKGAAFGAYTVNTHSYHGHDAKSDGVENETIQFFRYVDDFIAENFSSLENTPLILMGLSENQGMFRSISKNKNLLDKGINRSINSVDEKKLKEEVWKVIEPIYLNKTKILLDKYREAQAELKSSKDLLEIAHGCSDGRIDTLIVESDVNINSYYNIETRQLEELNNEIIKNDLINQLVVLTFMQDGEVVVLPEERFPEESGCVAIFRY